MNPDEVATDDPLEALKKLKAQQAADPLAQLKAMKAPKPAGHDYHAEFKSGALEKRMQGANARDVANAAENTDVVGPVAAAGHALGATMANIGEGIPGFEAVQAGARTLASHVPNVSMQHGMPLVTPGPGPQSYSDALSDIRHETDKLPTVLKTGERILGAMPLTKVLPGSAAAGGAILGAADQALSADPDQTLGGRAVRTAIGAASGAAVGKIGETVVTGLRTLVSPSAAANVLARKAAQASSARRLYSAALAQGQGKAPTPEVQQFLQEPDIAEIVGELQKTRPLQAVPAHAPEMLDAIYKTLSDRAAQLKKGLESIAPTRPNIGRFRMQDTKAAQSGLLDAVSGARNGLASAMQANPRGAPGMSIPATPPIMPGYRAAVQDFAQHAKGIEGVNRGYDAMRIRLMPNLPRSQNLTRTTPEALEEWSRAADDASKSAAGEGVLGGVKTAAGIGVRTGFKALRKAPGVMRDAGVPAQSISDMLLKLGLISGSAALQ